MEISIGHDRSPMIFFAISTTTSTSSSDTTSFGIDVRSPATFPATDSHSNARRRSCRESNGATRRRYLSGRWISSTLIRYRNDYHGDRDHRYPRCRRAARSATEGSWRSRGRESFERCRGCWLKRSIARRVAEGSRLPIDRRRKRWRSSRHHRRFRTPTFPVVAPYSKSTQLRSKWTSRVSVRAPGCCP